MRRVSAETRCRQARVPSIAWKIAAVVWALVIFHLSTSAYGPGLSGRLLAGALSLLHLAIPVPRLEVLNHFARKAAHLGEYAVLAVLLCAASEEQPLQWRPQRVLACFLVVLAYSLTDEFHQRFVPGRNASLADCGIDSIGGAMGVLVYHLNHLRLRAAE